MLLGYLLRHCWGITGVLLRYLWGTCPCGCRPITSTGGCTMQQGISGVSLGYNLTKDLIYVVQVSTAQAAQYQLKAGDNVEGRVIVLLMLSAKILSGELFFSRHALRPSWCFLMCHAFFDCPFTSAPLFCVEIELVLQLVPLVTACTAAFCLLSCCCLSVTMSVCSRLVGNTVCCSRQG